MSLRDSCRFLGGNLVVDQIKATEYENIVHDLCVVENLKKDMALENEKFLSLTN